MLHPNKTRRKEPGLRTTTLIAYSAREYVCVTYVCYTCYSVCTVLTRQAASSLDTVMLLWTKHKPDMQEQSVCQTHTPVAAVSLNARQASVLPCSCLRWDCQTPGMSAVPSQICSHHPLAEQHCHDSLVMLWTQLSLCLQLRLRSLPQPDQVPKTSTKLRRCTKDINLCWITQLNWQ